jgi:hypothetical protein
VTERKGKIAIIRFIPAQEMLSRRSAAARRSITSFGLAAVTLLADNEILPQAADDGNGTATKLPESRYRVSRPDRGQKALPGSFEGKLFSDLADSPDFTVVVTKD